MRNATTALALLAGLAAAGCSSAPPGDSLGADPHEAFNRDAHAINKEVDRAAFGPVARGYGTAVPEDVRNMVNHFSTNWKLPRETLQYLLQGRPEESAKSFTRFAVNTLLGLGGLLDLATEMNLPYRKTGFDEVFEVWGIPDGGYLELPLGGPGTDRDWTGWVLDTALDPTWFILPPAANEAVLGSSALDLVNDRYVIDPVIDEVLYRSEDSYSALRLSYLQNKRAALQGGTGVEQLEDVYADY